MKRILRSVLRRLGFDVVRTAGPMRSSTMEQALGWLTDHGVQVSTVLDVGASDGRWSAECMAAYPNASYVLYEPNPVHAPGVLEFAAGAPTQVVHEAAAVGAVLGTAEFVVTADPFGGALADGGGSVGQSTREVSMVTLDESVTRLGLSGPFLVKLDTHGFERSILEGAEGVLAEASVLIIEAYAHRLTSEGLYFWELCELLHQRGFRPVDLVDVMHRERDDSLWQMDLMFLQSSWEGFRSNDYR